VKAIKYSKNNSFWFNSYGKIWCR